MLSPKRVKFRKRQKGRLKGNATRGTEISFGDIGIKTLEHGKLTAQQIDPIRHSRTSGLDRFRREKAGENAPYGDSLATRPQI